ncbi:MarR family winged helix-turn-helix transcriptional regulator [uncultured Winogradskyella sp.]|uniref:MarR family winged helix-turn-helix transcriptional regulator n=1 Tax=uncultured Winogradskyella sp. TaxID=395353 RepID=UPI00260CFFC7|nr:MarR family winged helix-turn-helix transcriptional regulator [uncultured Winogradskyella sp.]
MNTDFPLLESCNPLICYSGRIMHVERIISNIFRNHISPFGLTNSQLSILFFTSKKGIVTQNLLSEMLFLEKSSVSRNMKRLLDTQLLQKKNKRQIEITLKGKRLLEEVIPEWNKAMEKINSIIEPEGQKAFDFIYNKFTK